MSRIPCCVPFCKATIARSRPHDDEQEAICAVHMRPVSAHMKRMHRAAVKRAMALMNSWTNPDDAPEAEQRKALSLIRAERWLWNRIKRKAIEAAGGIG